MQMSPKYEYSLKERRDFQHSFGKYFSYHMFLEEKNQIHTQVSTVFKARANMA